ncbi:MAG: dihydrolipoamide acetyltransferase family protein [Burkholderiaceae bacterium]
MAVHIITMPDLGEGIAEVELVAWRVQAGDTVLEDQVLVDVMTDKATVEIPSPLAGRVLALGGEAGQLLAVGSELIRLEIASAELGAELQFRQGPEPRIPSAPPSVRADVAPHAGTRETGSRPIAAPAVRRRAWELGIDLHQVRPSGPDGRIVQADLDNFRIQAIGPTTDPIAVMAGMAQPVVNGEESVRLTGLRRKIAQKMQEAKRRIPHFTYVEEIDVTELEILRSRLNQQGGEKRPHLTLLPFLLRALVPAVGRFPDINARFDDENGVLIRYSSIHLGIATQTEAGLLVPVLRNAEALDVWASAAEVARLAGAARSGKLSRDELSGSTLTLTSLGKWGGIVSTPIINHPEVAIIGVNRIAERPVLRNGAVVARQMMNLSSSFDHRVIDGQVAAQFIQSLRASLENPGSLLNASEVC